MFKKEIPHYVQILKKCFPDSEELKSKLILVYNKGGIDLDKEMLRRNPNAKKRIMFVSSSIPIQTNKTTYQIRGNEEQGHWIYCGNLWYVRKIEKKFEFAQYLTYNTKTKLTGDPWDEEEH